MTTPPKLLILINWEEDGKWDLFSQVRGRINDFEVLQPFFLKQIKNPFLKKLSIYFSEFYLPLVALLRRKDFDVVISWSLRFGICYGILNRLWRSPGAPKHVIYDFHVNLVRNDWRHRLKLLLPRLAVPGIDFFLCTSTLEESIYSKMFNIPQNSIRFFPMSPPIHLCEGYDLEQQDYMFTYGNSDRDYDTLIEAVKDIPTKLLILSQAYNPPGPLPANVELMTQGRYGLDLWKLIGSARLVVLPLQDFNISAGQTAMLEIMALGRPLIVTSNMATREYAVHGKTALFCKEKDPEEIRHHIRFLLEHPEKAERMGREARKTAATYPVKDVAVLFSVLDAIMHQDA